VTGGDGLLVRDVDGNGAIDDVSELFGTNETSGFAALGELDSNAEGVIDANDAEFASLRVWIDANGDAISAPDELKTLDELGIVSIEVEKLEIGQLVRDLDGDGFYDAQATLVGNAAANEAFVETTTELEQFDTNADGVIDSADTGCDALRVWVDANDDGVTDAEELKTLGELGLTSIGFSSTEPADGEDEINGNAVSQIGAYKLSDGSTRQIADVALAYYDGGSGGGGGGSGGGGGGGSGTDPTAPDDGLEYASEADGGGGEDTLDYTTFEDDITITVVAGKPVVVDTGVVKHKAINFEKIDATNQEDRLVLGGDDPVATGFADTNSATSLTIDFGGQGKTVPAGPGPGEGTLANGGKGDTIDAEANAKGVFINLRDSQAGYTVNLAGQPLEIAATGVALNSGLAAAAAFTDIFKELTKPTDLSGFGAGERAMARA